MPSIAWFPLAICSSSALNEAAILFVVVLGAAPSIANGLINGIDNIPPILLRAGRVLGARGWRSFRYVILPAALPSFVGGLKQGWAFAWRSLLAGELIVMIPGRESLGQLLEVNRDLRRLRGVHRRDDRDPRHRRRWSTRSSSARPSAGSAGATGWSTRLSAPRRAHASRYGRRRRFYRPPPTKDSYAAVTRPGPRAGSGGPGR